MQHTYWNGTYWPTTLQWIGAFIDTLLAASEISFTNALIRDNGNVPGAQTSTSAIQTDIQEYFEEIEAYYGGEDTIQIFGAAYDDAQWVVLEWLEAIRFINKYDAYASSSLGQADIARFAHRAHVFYNIVQDQFNTSLCGGGLTWNPTLAVYKNSITNELFIDSSIWMYLYWPGDSNNTDPYPSPNYINATNNTLPSLPTLAVHDPLLLQNAKAEYTWFKSQPFADSQGLIIDGFHVSDNQTTCDEPDTMVYTYNQGVILSGLRGLWEATGDSSYLTDGYAYIATVINATGWNSRSWSEAGQWAGLGRNGIMEDYCDAPANCSQDNQVFKGIYFHHLDLFCEPLPTTTPLVPGLTYTASSALATQHANSCNSYTQWIEHNAYAALSTRNDSGIIGGWWGAPYVNKTQNAAPEYSVSRPYGSQDIRNHPELLNQSPWVCNGWYCDSYGKGNYAPNYAPTYGVGKRMAEVMRKKRMTGKMARRDVNDEGRGRTVETEAAGLGVVKAASDFTMKRPRS
ncbi:Six-hairpin glycosidase [Teratosphaeria nubilosa]|uniref:Six-hairpin glycosidase n=1 Tax=Teratosphaeria nubilosa TaxID=161662 RepID=A0A6G1LHN9_9PEZI|nr:Six-hairpin glycosidase [Teratosphaeria nubilosa]